MFVIKDQNRFTFDLTFEKMYGNFNTITKNNSFMT